MNLEVSFMNSWMPVHAEEGALQKGRSVTEMRGKGPLLGVFRGPVSSLLVGIYLLGVSTTESTPLLLIILRLLLTRTPCLRKLRKGWLTKRREAKAKFSMLPKGTYDRFAWPERRPPARCCDRGFRRVWIPPRVGSSFENKRLMRMTHPDRL
jgi:hypothetical protein